MKNLSDHENSPLASLEQWEDDVLQRYSEPAKPAKSKDEFRNYDHAEDNPDTYDERFNTKYGVYSDHCGLDNVHMSWGHDEYLYQITKNHLPEEALYMIRYHSFYSQHREHAYDHLLNDHDQQMFKWVDKFNPYDLYSKSPKVPIVSELKPYYEDLIAKYLPVTVKL